MDGLCRISSTEILRSPPGKVAAAAEHDIFAVCGFELKQPCERVMIPLYLIDTFIVDNSNVSQEISLKMCGVDIV